jgi:hypothetical protein
MNGCMIKHITNILDAINCSLLPWNMEITVNFYNLNIFQVPNKFLNFKGVYFEALNIRNQTYTCGYRHVQIL